MTPRQGPTAFPGEQHAVAGETPEFPVLIGPSTRDEVGTLADMWNEVDRPIEKLWNGEDGEDG